MTGKLIRIEKGPDGDRSASNRPLEKYRRWRFVLLRNGEEHSCLTGRVDLVKRAETLIGSEVAIARGGKCGIVGAIRAV